MVVCAMSWGYLPTPSAMQCATYVRGRANNPVLGASHPYGDYDANISPFYSPP
jgi:hypothetical protein